MSQEYKPINAKGSKFEKKPSTGRATPNTRSEVTETKKAWRGVGTRVAAKEKIKGTLPPKNK